MAHRLCMVLVGLFLVAASAPAAPASEPVMLVRVDHLSGVQFLGILTLGFEIVGRDGTRLDLVVPAPQARRLAELGVAYEVLDPDMAATYASRYAARGVGGFRSFMEIEYFLDSLADARPDIVSPKTSLGQTAFFGLDIWCAKISDNPEVDENEPEVLYVSLIHAREPAGMAALINVMQYLADNYDDDPVIAELVNSRELYFVPCQNPDGYVWNESMYADGGGMWRKNMGDNSAENPGVDCNRNYGFQWGYDDFGSSPYPSSDTYRGSAPFSEPETRAIRDFALSHHLSIIHNFHSYADLVIWPWGYDYQFTDREEFYAALGDSMTVFNNYREGVSWTLYPTNGDADDWAWGDTVSKPRIISVTTEIGGSSDGFWPYPENIPGLMAENLFPSLLLARIADCPYRIAPPLPPVMKSPYLHGDTLLLVWQSVDTANPAVRYRIERLENRSRVTDSAETNDGLWTTRGMRLTDNRAYSGTLSWHHSMLDGDICYMQSAVPVVVAEGDSLSFMVWYDIQQYFDYFYAEVSTDGGLTFVTLPGNLTTDFDPYGMNRGHGITGQSGSWVRAAFDLSPWIGRNVIFRLSYITDGYSFGDGVFIDDVQPLDVYGLVSTVDSLVSDTAYRLQNCTDPQVRFRVAATDAQGQVSRWSNLVFRGSAFEPGDVNGSGSVNIADLTYLVTHLFRGGPAPVPEAAGDVNCSGNLNIADLATLVTAMFRGGTLTPCG